MTAQFVVNDGVPKDPLGVCDVENVRDKMLHPVVAVHLIGEHGTMRTLDGGNLLQDFALHELAPPNEVLALCGAQHAGRHRTEGSHRTPDAAHERGCTWVSSTPAPSLRVHPALATV